MSLAYPREYDWESACDHFQPHCKTCWAIEESQLNVLSNDHCAKGPVKKKSVPKKKTGAKKKIKKKLVDDEMSQSQKDDIIIQSQKASIAAAAAATFAKGVVKKKKTVVKKKKTVAKKKKTVAKKTVAKVKKQLGGVQGPIKAAIKTAYVEEPEPEPITPWEVSSDVLFIYPSGVFQHHHHHMKLISFFPSDRTIRERQIQGREVLFRIHYVRKPRRDV